MIPISNLTATWDNSSNTYTGIGMNITVSLYDANSTILNLKVNSNSIIRLSANGELALTGNLKVNNVITLSSNGDMNLTGNLTVNTSTLFVNKKSKKVGIKTVNPATSLEISDIANLSLRFSSSNDPSYYREIGRDNLSSGDFIIRRAQGSSPSTDFCIDPLGNIGLGTPDPYSGGTTIKGTLTAYDANNVLKIRSVGYNTYANGSSSTLSTNLTASSMVLIYDTASGAGGMYFVHYNKVILVANGSGYPFYTSDIGGGMCLIISGHLLKFKNNVGISRDVSIAMYGSYDLE